MQYAIWELKRYTRDFFIACYGCDLDLALGTLVICITDPGATSFFVGRWSRPSKAGEENSWKPKMEAV